MISLKEFLRQHLADMPIDYGKMTRNMAVAALGVLQEKSDDMARRYIKELEECMNEARIGEGNRHGFWHMGYDFATAKMLKFLKEGEKDA